ncbi:efflux RND transporter periplasmic adaptor subunit [Paenibacillus tyrfis]|uniref:Uncharacterized protein n=1 Tax=Paenibacillus tyrfis TaxID=1501230 RepID=A0A081NUG3_9BACL|nr:efflux RND transporter periplasmic adaptor subunit [Paenibacillus tyrfis]KEQ22086.1 hypothetical protein ET33_27775 [Paenibacillus tyrfis]
MKTPKTKKKKWIFLSISSVVVAGTIGIFYILSTSKQTMPSMPNTVQAKQGNIRVTASGSGATAPTERETIKPRDNSPNYKLLVKKGDLVKKGQEIITYEGKDNTDLIYQEKLAIEKKELDLNEAMNKFKKNFQDESMIVELKNNIRKLQIDIELSNRKIKTYKEEQLPPPPLLATIDGEIIELNHTVGDQVNSNAMITEIVNYNNLKLNIQVDEMDVLKIKAGQPAVITVDALPNTKFNGTVSEVAREGKSKNGISFYNVAVQFINPGQIKAGMSARAEIFIEGKDNIMVVPIEAVQQRQGKSFVLVQDTVQNNPVNDKPSPAIIREVTVGIQNESYIEIISGLNVGENIVIGTSGEGR